eukprot:3514082-Alexandrium_andersonii.AAC.1
MRLDILHDGSSERTIELSCRCTALSICPPIQIVDASGHGKADVNNGAQHTPESLEFAELMYTGLVRSHVGPDTTDESNPTT